MFQIFFFLGKLKSVSNKILDFKLKIFEFIECAEKINLWKTSPRPQFTIDSNWMDPRIGFHSSGDQIPSSFLKENILYQPSIIVQIYFHSYTVLCEDNIFGRYFCCGIRQIKWRKRYWGLANNLWKCMWGT